MQLKAQYTFAELLELAQRDLAAKGYAPASEAAELNRSIDSLHGFVITFSVIPTPPAQQPDHHVVEATKKEKTEAPATKKGKQYYRKASDLNDEEKEARRAKWREQAQTRRDARLAKMAESGESPNLEEKAEIEEVVAPSPIPFRGAAAGH
jgi:hypothetical protein